jgi:hypothetical protein
MEAGPTPGQREWLELLASYAERFRLCNVKAVTLGEVSLEFHAGPPVFVAADGASDGQGDELEGETELAWDGSEE